MAQKSPDGELSLEIVFFLLLSSQEPLSQILLIGGGGGGGPTEVHILYLKKLQLQNLSTQKNHYFLKHTQKYPLLLFRNPKKIPASFIGPKESLLAEISDPKKSVGPSPPPPPPSSKFVNGAPGIVVLHTYLNKCPIGV